ncbi:HK97 family phage prohead protease [Pseudogemmobacter blasticus]|nr:HK97 family phage prohead protease [Fuscovulum blasticum]
MDRIEFKAQLSVDDAGAITGIAWPFFGPDRVGDVIERGAFKALPPLPMLDTHDQAKAVGVWEEITETTEGLAVKGRLLVEDVERAREVRALIKAGAMRGLPLEPHHVETIRRMDQVWLSATLADTTTTRGEKVLPRVSRHAITPQLIDAMFP